MTRATLIAKLRGINKTHPSTGDLCSDRKIAKEMGYKYHSPSERKAISERRSAQGVALARRVADILEQGGDYDFNHHDAHNLGLIGAIGCTLSAEIRIED